jgi:hypothetical protein
MNDFKVGDTVRVRDDAVEYTRENPAGWTTAMSLKDIITIENTKIQQGKMLYVDDEEGFSWIKEQLEPMDNTDNFVPFYVKVDGPSHSKMLQQVAFEEGYQWRSGNTETKHTGYLYLSFGLNHFSTGNSHNKVIGYSKKGPKDEKLLEDPTLQEFRDALNGHYFEPEPEPIEILGHEVEIFENTVVVGCREFSASDVNFLYDLAVNAKDHEAIIDGVDFEVDSTLLINGREVDPDLIIEVFDRFNE